MSPAAFHLPAQCGTFSQPSTEEEQRAFRNALGCYATGIAIVTGIDGDGHPMGLTVNSFAAVSLEPPLVLWSLDNASHSMNAFRQASHYAVNVLAAHQTDLSVRFSTWPVDRFAGLAWQSGVSGAPVLAGCAAWFEARNEIQYPAGDHHIFVGRVERFHQADNVAPLLYHGGQYRQLAG